MNDDDHVCLCFQVSQRKICHYLRRERPKVASQLSDCLGAGTGCGWCVPFLKQLHRQWADGQVPALNVEPASYARRRADYRAAQPNDQPSAEDDSSTC